MNKLQAIKTISERRGLILKQISPQRAIFGYTHNDHEYSRNLSLDIHKRDFAVWKREIDLVSEFLLNN